MQGWSLGLQGGVNLFMTDFNDRRVGPGFSASLRHRLSDAFALGVTAGYEELKAKQTPWPAGLRYDYVKLHALPVALQLWTSPWNGARLSPYLYAGAGALFFTREDGGRSVLDRARIHSSFVLPLGLGVELTPSGNTAFTLELGYRLGSDGLETLEGGSPDGYPTVKLGLTLPLGGGGGDESADSDGDGLTDDDELARYRTNPMSADTDGDGIPDGMEATIHRTDPARADTDGDGLDDGPELMTHGTDPFVDDTDGDGLPDGDEVRARRTNPLATDTDGDGLTDGEEALTFRSDPLAVDSDGDGIADGEEVAIHRTDPARVDTDGGGVEDGVEIARGTNPLNPRDDAFASPLILEPGAVIVLEGVTFETGGATLTGQAVEALEKVYAALLAGPAVKAEIAGYTDNVGRPEANEQLSLRRAQAVRSWLVRKGISPLRLTAVGMGMKNPVASNATADGRARNRRIELHILD